MIPTNSHLQVSLSRLVLAFLITSVVIRPIIDLLGRFEGEVLNPGGALGIVFALGIVVLILVSRGAWGLRAQALLLLLVFLFMLGLAHVAFGDDAQAASIAFARLAVGYSSALLVPLAARISPSHAIPWASRAVVGIVTASLVPVTIAWLQLGGVLPYSYFDYFDGAWVGRPSGGYHQPNSLGRLLAFIALYVGILAAARQFSTKRVIALWFAVTATVLITTHRTSIVAAGLIITASLIIAYSKLDRIPKLLHTIARLALLGGAVTGVVALSAPQPSFEALGRQLHRTAGVVLQVINVDNDVATLDLRGRNRIWSASVEHLAQQDPVSLLFGTGSAPFEAHNELLNALMVYGLLGLAALAIVHTATLSIAWSACSRTGRRFLLVNLLYYLLFSVTLQPLDYPFFMWLYFAAQTLILSTHRRDAQCTHTATHDTPRSAPCT